jgi:hypothetical protein
VSNGSNQIKYATEEGARVIAILLGALGLPVDDTVDVFLRLCKEISLGDELDPHLRSERLESATKILLQKIGVSEKSKLLEDLKLGEGCKVYVMPLYSTQSNITYCALAPSHTWPRPT